MEFLARLSVRRPVAVTVFAAAIAVLGVLAWKQLPLDLLPDVQSPTVVVSVRSGDRPPLEMERIYGERVEQQLFTVRDIRAIDQVARTGRLIATVTFEWDADMDLALVDVEKAVGNLRSDPEVDEVLVRRFDPRQTPVLTLGLIAPSGRPDLAELRRLARRQVAVALERQKGVAEVRVLGGRDREVRVLVDRYRLEALGLTLGELETRIRAANVDIDAGTLEEGGDVYLVRGVQRFQNVNDVAEVVVRYARDASGRQVPVRVADVAEVVVDNAEVRHLVRVDGTEGVGLSIYKEAGANTVAVSRIVREAFADIGDDLPGVEVRLISDEAALVEDALADVQQAALVGIALAILVLVLFLRSPGPTVVISIAVPVSLFGTLFLMHLAGHTLNVMTLGGLALGAGMLVDNAIVVVENIFRRRAEGDSPGEAAARGTGEVAGAIASSTLTTCAVFLPVVFVQGLAARLVTGLSFAVVISLLVSLIVAAMLIPALSTWLLPRGSARVLDPGSTRVERFVKRLLHRPFTVVAVTVVFAVVGIQGLRTLGTELLPPSDPRQFSVRLVGPPGQRVEATARVAAVVEEAIRAVAGSDVAATQSEVGRLPEDDRLIREEQTEENTARVRVRLAAGGVPAGEVVESASAALRGLQGIEASWEVGESALATALGTTGPPVVVELSGRSLDDLRTASVTVTAALRGRPELWNVVSSFEGGPPELRVRLDRALADGLGVDLNTVAATLEASLDGRRVTRLSLGDEEWDVMLRLPDVRREELTRLPLQTASGGRIALGDVVTFELDEGAREIFRRDQRRVARVTARIAPGSEFPDAMEAAREALDGIDLPAGLRSRLAGEEAERARTFLELEWAGLLALLLVFMVLAGTFESLIHPLTVTASVPFALIGVGAILVVLGRPIGVMEMLGMIVLAGVAVNDAILLVDRARRLMADGVDRIDALARAAGQRFRPILMTTATTILALLPLAVGGGESARLRSPLALTVIGGLLASTVTSLLVIPCLYLLLDRLRPRRRRAEGEVGVNLFRLPVDRPVATSMFFLAVILLGIVGWLRIPVELMPPLTGDRLFANFARPGSDPEVVERELLLPLAARAARLEGVQESWGEVRGSSGTLQIRFLPGTDLKVRELELRRTATELAREQPPGSVVQVGAQDFTAVSRFVLLVQITGMTDRNALFDFVDEQVRPRLASVSGVAQVLPTGGAGREITVRIDDSRTAAVGVDPNQVTSRLVSAIRRMQFLGGLDEADRRTSVVLDARPRGTTSLGEIRIDDTRGVLLRHVAEVEYGTALEESAFRINGRPAVGLMVFKEEGANLVRLGRQLRDRMDVLTEEFEDRGLDFTLSFDAAELVESQLDRLKRLALVGFLIALAVLYVFLRQWRAVAVVAVAVPVSLLAAAAMLYLIGMSLNLVTLFGLAVGIGMLVDNSIVVYEAVQRQLERGSNPDDAAERGVRRTARAILSASATNAIVFLPIAFVAIDDVTIRMLVRILALAIVIPLGASLLVAVGLVPLLARRLAAPAAIAQIREVRRRRERLAGWMPPDRAREVFSGILKVALRRPGGWISIIALAVVVTVIIALPLVAFGTASREAARADTILMSVRLPSGGSLDAATEAFAVLEESVVEMDGVETVESFIREDGGSLNVYLVDEDDRPADLTAGKVREAVRSAAVSVPGIDVLSGDASGGGLGGGGGDQRGANAGLQGQTPTEIVLSGPDFNRLNALGANLERRLRSIPDIGSVRVSATPGREEYRVEPVPALLAAYGLTGDQVLPLLRNVRREGIDLRIGLVLDNGREIPLTVRRQESSARARDDLERLPVPTRTGVIPLGALASVRRMPGEPAIQHHDGRREISVFYTLGPEAPQTGPARTALESRIEAAVTDVHRPTGYSIETPAPDEGFAWFKTILVPVVLLLFALLAITFESLTLPLLVLLALPLTVLGSTWGMAVSGTPAGPMALAGALALIGLTVNPAILLVDRMQQRVRSGSTPAGSAALAAVRERTRPVLMTAATTLAGLWPLAIATGRDNELWPPFAVVVMGGLLTSAALTLLMIPVGFVILHRLDRLFGRLGPWVVIGWAFATTAIMMPLIRLGWVATTTWQILTTVLVAAILLGVAAFAFHRPVRPEPRSDDGPPVLETRYLTKTYGRPGPVGRAWRVTDRFVRRVARLGGRPFEPIESRARIIPLVLAASGIGYLAASVSTRFWQIVFAYVAAALVAGALREIRRARGRVDAIGRALPGGPEGWLATLAPWGAFAWIVADIVAVRVPGTEGKIALALLAILTGAVQFGRRTARRIASDEIPETLASGRLRRTRTVWRRWSRKLLGQDLPPREVRALRSVSLRFEQGMIGVLGPNGAGKTTFLRLVAGILDSSSGTVHLGGVPLDDVRNVLARWVGYLPQDFGLPGELTAREYLEYWAVLYEIPEEDRAERVGSLLEEVGLGERSDDRIGSYSGGMRQRVAVARTLLRLPPVIIVDEPTVGLDPRERIRFRNLLSRLARGRVVLFSTHVVEDVAVACQRVVVLARGRLVFDGDPTQLADHARGKVWEVRLLAEERADLPDTLRIVDEVPEAGGMVRLRILAEASPHAAATAVDPTLEDGYFVLAGSRREASEDAA